jgi:hypothetical protein
MSVLRPTASVDLAWFIGIQGGPVEAVEISRQALGRDRRVLGPGQTWPGPLPIRGDSTRPNTSCARCWRTWSGRSPKTTTDRSLLAATSPTRWPPVGTQGKPGESIGTYGTFSSVAWATSTRKRSPRAHCRETRDSHGVRLLCSELVMPCAVADGGRTADRRGVGVPEQVGDAPVGAEAVAPHALDLGVIGGWCSDRIGSPGWWSWRLDVQ